MLLISSVQVNFIDFLWNKETILSAVIVHGDCEQLIDVNRGKCHETGLLQNLNEPYE